MQIAVDYLSDFQKQKWSENKFMEKSKKNKRKRR
jgi:hypothetical protein